MEPDEICFDEEDRNIFLVDDIQLKAEALRHSILPRMHTLSNELIEYVRDIFSTEVLEDSSLTLSPHFRQHNKIVDLKKNYREAVIEISGRRTEGHWPGLAKPDGKPVSIVPFGMSIELDADGISTLFYLSRPTFTQDTFKKFFDFMQKYNNEICAILHKAEVTPWTAAFVNEFPPMTSLSTMLKWSFETKFNKIVFQGKKIAYPINPGEATRQLLELVYLFPIYDSFIQISKGKEERFLEQLEKVNSAIWNAELDVLVDKQEERLAEVSPDLQMREDLKELAGRRIKVMPAMRWQVFQRDKWRCVSCGHSVDDNIKLHIDHIIPRSKGGKNEIGNYQTLCDVCNIGKSNKDNTDIKMHRSVSL